MPDAPPLTAPHPLELVPALSFGDPGGNLVVEGDNLQAMASLRAAGWAGAVDVAYLDPPYNTGDRDFAYSPARLRDPDADAGELVWVGADDPDRHDVWLRYMAPRMRLLRELLAPGGVCLVSINQIELFRLGALLDATFGEDNRLGVVVWRHGADNARNNRARIRTEHDYVLCYARNVSRLGDRPGPARSVIEIGADAAPALLEALLPGYEPRERFEDAKPVELIVELLRGFAGPGALVLDPFAGSGTTGHAVLRLNAADGGRRRFALIEEGTAEDPCCRTLLAPRLRAAIEAEGLPGGFAFVSTGCVTDR
jgi:DNA modification methylase